MFEIDKFNKEVIEDFFSKKAEKKLEVLERATRAKLRDLFLSKLAKGELEKDISTLNEIFDPLGRYESLEAAIKRGEDKFRPVQDFIIERTTKPTDTVVKLLSILIDFEPRPYAKWTDKNRTTPENDNEGGTDKSDLGESDDPGNNVEESNPTAEDTDREDGSNPTKKIKAQYLHSLKNNQLVQMIGLLLIVLTLCTSIYLIKEKQCMCWVEDRYVKVSCKDTTMPSKIIALNEEKLYHFKKIVQPDTLTIDDVNKVWYSKINNQVEFFTGPGMHPIHHHRSLKAATRHIIDLYAGNNASE